MRAILVTPGAPGSLAIGETARQEPLPSEALVKVAAISLNLGEVRRAQTEAKGLRTGWDFAGTVVRGAATGKGPQAGARVVGLIERGAWAEEVVVPSDQVAAIPDAVTFAEAATLPVAGLTALYSLEQRGGVLGRRVLVTGASGGVGHFACRLAREAGADVVALVRNQRHGDLAREAGAHVVVAGEDAAPAAPHGPYDLIIDGVGGAVLGQALSLLAKDGVCVSYGVSAGSAVTFDARTFFRSGRPVLYGLYLFEEFQRRPAWNGLERLAAMVAAGSLKPHISREASWQETGAVAQALLDRRITGKAVLHVH
jgi:NADPH:quinone reductase-like Zn-dependent oxidoreductase